MVGYFTTPTAILISPHGAVLQVGSSTTFTATCTYATTPFSDNCTAAGGAVYSSSLTSALTVNSSTGVATWVTEPTGGNNCNMTTHVGCYGGGYITATAGGLTDNAGVFGQHAGDTWQTYVTPDPANYLQNFSHAQLPLNVVVGATVALGYGFQINNLDNNPLQDSCTWSSSDPTKATISVDGHVTAVAPVSSVTLTCGRAGNGTYGSGGGQGNTRVLTIVNGGTGTQDWIVRSDGGLPYTNNTDTPNGQCTGKVDASYAAASGGHATLIWLPNVVYTIGQYAADQSTGHYQLVTTTGTSSTTAKPTWSSSGGNTTDGTVVWHDAGTYPTNQACGLQLPRYLWSTEEGFQSFNWIIAGGDRVIIKQGDYTMGADAFGLPGNCFADSADCYMPTIPSGTASRHTKILGENFASCPNPSYMPKVRLSYGSFIGINTTDSQFVDIQCMQITDNAGWGGGSFVTTPPCPGGYVDCGGNFGIKQSGLTDNVNYIDIFDHGLTEAINGPTGSSNVVANRFVAQGNTGAGIDMDDHPFGLGNVSVAGGLQLRNSIIQFAGCLEEWPIVHAYPYIECRDQSTGGYGDGLGTASTSGDWIFDNVIWFANFQDGLDLLHSGMHTLSVTNSQSIANDGQAYKIGSGATVIFRQNYANVNCARILHVFGDEPASAIVPGVSPCRAGGDGLLFSFTNQGIYSVQSNFMTGYNATMFDLACTGGWDFCPNANTIFQNNIVKGYSSTFDGSSGALPGLFFLGNASMPGSLGTAWATSTNNLYYDVRSCPTLSTNETCNTANPMFPGQPASPIVAVTSLDNYNYAISSSSPAKYAGIAYSGIASTDATGNTWHAPPSEGPLEFGSVVAAALPYTNIAGGSYGSAQTPTVTAPTPGAVICATTNGSLPTASPAGTCTNGSSVSSGSTVSISATATLQMLTTAAGFSNSPVSLYNYTITSPPPSTYNRISIGTTRTTGATR